MFLFCSLSSLLLVFALRLWYLYFCRQDIWEFKLRNSIREITDGVANSPLQIPNSQLRIQSQEPNSGIQHVEFRVATLNSHLEISKFEFSICSYGLTCHKTTVKLYKQDVSQAFVFWRPRHFQDVLRSSPTPLTQPPWHHQNAMTWHIMTSTWYKVVWHIQH